MCNNNGHCRKFDAGTMCPSFRATGEEQHLTRGRANTLRLALSGQLPAHPARTHSHPSAMYETMELCVSCKGCKRECPTGVDMAKMKIEFLHHYRKQHALGWRTGSFAYLPRYAPWAARLAWLANLRDAVPGLALLSEKLLGFSARRSLPKWRRDTFARRPGATVGGGTVNGEVVLLVDTFNNYFEPDNARAALAVLRAAGYRRAPAARDRLRAAIVLRPHVSRGRPGRRGARRSATHARGVKTLHRARRAGGGARAVVPARPARRVSFDAARPGHCGAGARTRCCSRNFSRARRTRAGSS